ncbi:MAG: sulfite oxidase heme-binding subunit YedZ [Anaerolineae bacterium]
MKWLRARWLRVLTYVGALTPLVIWGWQLAQGRFFDPVTALIGRTGTAGLILLLLTLACTPIHLLFGFKRMLRVRRALGLYTFAYVTLHLFIFAGLDYRLDWRRLRTAIFNQPYVLVGFAAFLLFLVLAVTSTDHWQKRLGKRWQSLQRLIYVGAVLDIIHVMWLRKNIWEPWPYLLILAVLLIIRVPVVSRWIEGARRHLDDQGPLLGG